MRRKEEIISEYYSSGYPKNLGKTILGKKSGLWRHYYNKEGYIKFIGNYKDDEKVGLWKFYDEYNRLYSVKNYSNHYYERYNRDYNVILIKSKGGPNLSRILREDLRRLRRRYKVRERVYDGKYYYLIDNYYNYFISIGDDYYRIYYRDKVIDCDQISGLMLMMAKLGISYRDKK